MYKKFNITLPNQGMDLLRSPKNGAMKSNETPLEAESRLLDMTRIDLSFSFSGKTYLQ